MDSAASTTVGSRRGPYSEAPSTSRAARALREVIRAASGTRGALARRLGIGVTDAAAIDHLAASPDPLGPVELGNRLGIRSASATALVDRLVEAGHVARTPHPQDRRRVALQVTDQGYDEVSAALRPMLAGIERAVDRLTPEQAAATAAFLREVAEVMREYVVTAPEEPPGLARRRQTHGIRTTDE
ncbi:MarR family winged helix-turn-helix transcriptional regulator [Salinispora arenicola]|uniref:MarR family transcriptional regulator n=2 Tax=Salinispora arenicola TaxID=168697 RepID=A0A542XI20_SALAC|nr:MarR family transcriptional regulator [Salinispora arenicola]MCN0151663.1 MarR family transcriptional regulator [Salinispora arenicola]MCN0180380.1 MarR family transcriptional regulator [Salinispora arenicola]NIL59513.1 MarR family transcriptional regulator [Salinispora arenicola]NIL61914.1 MarR family transcriptional regulator [Salinispora arenicola]TQL35440.1 DNA-binding MarR family transcriptional regulator [Salinispora arenicola]